MSNCHCVAVVAEALAMQMSSHLCPHSQNNGADNNDIHGREEGGHYNPISNTQTAPSTTTKDNNNNNSGGSGTATAPADRYTCAATVAASAYAEAAVAAALA